MSEWWRDQQLWRDLGPFLFSEAILSTGEGEVEELIDELEPPDGGRILDVGCGRGVASCRCRHPLVVASQPPPLSASEFHSQAASPPPQAASPPPPRASIAASPSVATGGGGQPPQ